ncbi:hypothetical protein L7F22_021785 [Adiantum nelumboides]|nr:hypothetical protein [Adiantum nelumboides]
MPACAATAILAGVGPVCTATCTLAVAGPSPWWPVCAIIVGLAKADPMPCWPIYAAVAGLAGTGYACVTAYKLAGWRGPLPWWLACVAALVAWLARLDACATTPVAWLAWVVPAHFNLSSIRPWTYSRCPQCRALAFIPKASRAISVHLMDAL